MKAKIFFVLLTVMVMVLMVTVVGCGAQSAETLTVTTAGSTSVQPLSEELAGAFMEKNQNVVINVQGGGSSQGIMAADQGVAEIGAASRHLKDIEEELGLTVYQIAVDGIGVVVNPKNDAVTGLTMEQVKKIYAGEVTNWNEVGGQDGEIRIVTRESGSGTRGVFEEVVMGKDTKIFDKAITQNSNGGVRTAVANDEAAIGYVSISYINDEVKAVKIEGVEATVDNVKSGSYKISRPFNYLTKGEPQGAAKEFIDFVMNEGQEIVAKDYISVK